MRRKNSLILVLMASLIATSCSPDLPSDGSGVEHYPGELTQKQYESLGEEQKYVVTIEVYNGSNTTEDFAVIKVGGEWVYQE